MARRAIPDDSPSHCGALPLARVRDAPDATERLATEASAKGLIAVYLAVENAASDASKAVTVCLAMSAVHLPKPR